ncbi:unnamed protein product [Prunus armeniaca]|uniref:Uncharacterized protein n=1 Tax=Prunus armeniaca TaxID=36596 RepID=A0A6J5X6K0_PRUAR|nr:unnamed protein product [Prunus armeniaca]
MDAHDQQQLKKSRVVRVNSEKVMGFLYHSSCQSRLPCDGAFYCWPVHALCSHEGIGLQLPR